MSVQSEDLPILLSALPATPVQRRLAKVVSLILFACFVALAPFSRTVLPRYPAFIPTYEVVLLTADLITAALLFGQYSIQRTRKLAVLAGAYVFSALIVIPHVLTFPGAFSETGLFGAGPQSAPWLYLGWHVVFPLSIIAYAMGWDDDRDPDHADGGSVTLTILAAVLTAIGGVAALAVLATVGNEWLPEVIAGDRYTGATRVAIATVCGASLAALFVLARKRQRSVLDLWLMVVMFAWLCDITLSTLLNHQRFDLGYYAGRLFGVLAASFVLVVLLSETIALYARVVRSASIERRERERRLNELEAVLIHLSRVSELGQIVSSLIHEVNQPLAAISNYLGAGIQLAEGTKSERLKLIMERSSEQASRAAGIIRHLRDFIANRESEKQVDDVPEMLRDAVRIALVGVGSEAPTIEMHCDPAASSALFNRVQIEQVVFNLVRNAVEAMAGTTRRALTIATEVTVDHMVQISIADTGPGLKPDVRAKLFEPFVTTKASGLGVGLSICRFIVETHGGQLQADDNPSGGTIFRFTIPQEAAPRSPAMQSLSSETLH
jgi:signal transduction histidine kinase